MEKLMTVTDVADTLKVCTKTARKVMEEIGVIRIGDRVRIRERSLEAWMNKTDAVEPKRKRKRAAVDLPDRMPRRKAQ